MSLRRSLAVGPLCRKLSLFLLSFLSLVFYRCCWVCPDRAAFVAYKGEHTARTRGCRPAGQVFGTLRWPAAGSRTDCFLLSKNERYGHVRITFNPAYCGRYSAKGGQKRDASLARSSIECAEAAPEASGSPAAHHIGLARIPASAPASATKAAPTTANAGVSFSPGLIDTALPPQSGTAPLIDMAFCKDDFVPSAAGVSASADSPFWHPQGADGLSTAVPSEGPVTFFDSRTELDPSLTGASDDAFFINFFGPLQYGAAEVAHATLAAAKRFIRTRELKYRRSQSSQQHIELHEPAQKYSEDNENKLERQYGGLHSKAEPQSTGLLVGSTDLSVTVAQKRFSTPPYWFVERVAYALRRLRPSSFGFLVAQMLEALCRISEAERKLGITIDSFVSHRMQTYLRKIRHMSPAEHAIHLTQGNSRVFNDVLKFRRGYPVFPWGLSVDPRITHSFMRQQLQVDEETLTQHFFAARRASGSAWTSAARYRVAVEEVPHGRPTQRVYEGFNSAALACIKHVIAGWQRPVYIFSMLERALSLRRLLAGLGVPHDALQHVYICGADGILLGTDPDDQRPREFSLGFPVKSPSDAYTEAKGTTAKASQFPSSGVASALSSFSASADATTRTGHRPDGFAANFPSQQTKSIAAKLTAALALWQYHVGLGFRGVPHFIDDDIQTLEAAAADSRMVHWRLYFCDWGFSTYEEKLRAIICDRVKILSTMSRMADLLLMPSYLPARLWALGSTTAPAEWLEEGRMSRWLRLSGLMPPVRRASAMPSTPGSVKH